MGEVDARSLAKLIAVEIKKESPLCKAFTPEELAELKGVAKLSARTKSTALATVIGFLVLGVIGLIIAGLGVRLGALIGRGP